MRSAYGLVMCLLFLSGFSTTVATAGGRLPEHGIAESGFTQNPSEFDLFPKDGALYFSLRFWRRKPVEFSTEYSRRTEVLLYEAVMDRLGLPYRYGGEDDRGYDCSGFVWRVCQEAGINFERSTARDLWESLPEAPRKDRDSFGTLVFFKGLTHMGIVRDDRSFYHSSSSQGVVESYFDDYWGSRVLGYRRALAPVERKQKKIRPRY